MSRHSRKTPGKRLVIPAMVGGTAGWIFGLNAVPTRVEVEEGTRGVVVLSPGMYWMEVFGFAVWFSILGSLIGGGLLFFLRLLKPKRSDET
ncbi:hypothetical protein C8P63_11786 [Melghirimyces profundicolus]|uniref:Uncharacterized protein n=1 Tax=Melghirimyces profundicolus TaxID=1242148 RepID=A0A2T6BQI9_9BACL|nr:hypothetical protein [Melghirimyces profundicolus]PTX58338.1 hypothetical protein C8P63_11786 [Melghirimyces profundicolus]